MMARTRDVTDVPGVVVLPAMTSSPFGRDALNDPASERVRATFSGRDEQDTCWSELTGHRTSSVDMCVSGRASATATMVRMTDSSSPAHRLAEIIALAAAGAFPPVDGVEYHLASCDYLDFKPKLICDTDNL